MNKKLVLGVGVAVLTVVAVVAVNFSKLIGPPAPKVEKESKLTLLYQGGRQANLEPCGCTSKPWGGIDREWNALQAVRAESPNNLFVDAGDMFSPEDRKLPLPQQRAKALALVEMLNELKLEVFSPGPADYELGVEFLKEAKAKANFVFLSSNVRAKGGAALFDSEVITVKDGVRIGIFSLASKERLEAKGLGAQYEVEDPASYVQRVLPELQKKSDLILCLTQLRAEEYEPLLSKITGVHVVVGSDPKLGTEKAFWYMGGRSLSVDSESLGYMLGRLDITLRLPFRGFYNPKEVRENQANLERLEMRLKQKKSAALEEEINMIKQRDPLADIPSGSEYTNTLVRLTKEQYGTANTITEKIAAEKERVRQEALK